jgi:phosphatidylglycerophosphatase A
MTKNNGGLRAATALATWFGCGFWPKGPGTVGSIGALIPAILVARYAGWPPWSFAIAAAVLFGPAVWAADVVARHWNVKDPQKVVVDEVVGQWLTIAGAVTLNWKAWLLAFVLFRLFDIWKPPPVRQLEALHGGLGVVADDAMAGIYAAIVLFAVGRFGLY